MNPLFECEKLSFAYAGRKEVFRDINLRIEAGSFVLIRGSSGIGKSTFLRLLVRLEEPSSGSIRFKGKLLHEHCVTTLRRKVSYIYQVPTLINGSVRVNLLLPFSFRENRNLRVPPDEELKQRLDALLMAEVNLEHSAHDLSIGQQQRLCLIRSLLLQPEVLLLDEPTSALDEESRQLVEKTAQNLCMFEGLTVIMVSHRRLCSNRVPVLQMLIKGGKIQYHHE